MNMVVLLMTLVSYGSLMAQPPANAIDPNEKCMICHGKKDLKVKVAPGKFKSLYVDYSAFKHSIHREKACVDCHTDVSVIPHPRPPKKRHCLECHYEGNVVGAPITKHPEKYKESIHARAMKEGNPNAPDCKDCHTTHKVLPPSNPESPIYKVNVPQTCGGCHVQQLLDYREGIHGKALLDDNNLDAPACNDCHTEHDILPPSDPRSKINPKNVINTCAHCHENTKIMKREGVPVRQVEAYKESFHGIAIKFGVVTAANCVSCHGAHKILPQSDPRSPIYPLNLAKTCGKCHPNASENVAKGKFHVIPTEPSAGIVYYIGTFFKWFTFLVLLGLIVHIILDIIGRIRTAGGEK